MSRTPLPAGLARTVRVMARFRPTGYDQFVKACDKRQVTLSEGLRLAAAEWTAKVLGGS